MAQAVDDHEALQSMKLKVVDDLKQSLVMDIENLFEHPGWSGNSADMKNLNALHQIYEKYKNCDHDKLLSALHDKTLEFPISDNASPTTQFFKLLLELNDLKNHDLLLQANNDMMQLHNNVAVTVAKENKPLLTELQSEVKNLLNHNRWLKEDGKFIEAMRVAYKNAHEKYGDINPIKIFDALKDTANKYQEYANSKAAQNFVNQLEGIDYKDKVSIINTISNVAELHNSLSAGKNKSINISYRQQAG